MKQNGSLLIIIFLMAVCVTIVIVTQPFIAQAQQIINHVILDKDIDTSGARVGDLSENATLYDMNGTAPTQSYNCFDNKLFAQVSQDPWKRCSFGYSYCTCPDNTWTCCDKKQYTCHCEHNGTGPSSCIGK